MTMKKARPTTITLRDGSKLTIRGGHPTESILDALTRMTRGHGVMCPCDPCKAIRGL